MTAINQTFCPKWYAKIPTQSILGLVVLVVHRLHTSDSPALVVIVLPCGPNIITLQSNFGEFDTKVRWKQHLVHKDFVVISPCNRLQSPMMGVWGLMRVWISQFLALCVCSGACVCTLTSCCLLWVCLSASDTLIKCVNFTSAPVPVSAPTGFVPVTTWARTWPLMRPLIKALCKQVQQQKFFLFLCVLMTHPKPILGNEAILKYIGMSRPTSPALSRMMMLVRWAMLYSILIWWTIRDIDMIYIASFQRYVLC